MKEQENSSDPTLLHSLHKTGRTDSFVIISFIIINVSTHTQHMNNYLRYKNVIYLLEIKN